MNVNCPVNTKHLYNVDVGPTLYNVIHMFCACWVYNATRLVSQDLTIHFVCLFFRCLHVVLYSSATKHLILYLLFIHLKLDITESAIPASNTST